MVASDIPVATVPTGVAVPSERGAIVAVMMATVLTQGRSALPAALALVPADTHAIPRQDGPIGPSAIVGPNTSSAPWRADQRRSKPGDTHGWNSRKEVPQTGNPRRPSCPAKRKSVRPKSSPKVTHATQ